MRAGLTEVQVQMILKFSEPARPFLVGLTLQLLFEMPPCMLIGDSDKVVAFGIFQFYAGL